MRGNKNVQWIKCYNTMFLLVGILVMTFCTISKAESMLDLTATVSSYKTVLLQWNSTNAEHVYQIQRSKGESDAYQVLATLSGQVGTVKCYDDNVVVGKQYTYRIVQMSGDNMIAASNSVVLRVGLPAPTKVKAKVVKESRIQVSWGTVKKATSYTIYRSTKPNKSFKKLGTTKKKQYTDYDVQKGKSYYYKVVANYKKKKQYTSADSEVACVHMKPEAPTVVGCYTKKKVKLTWKKVKGADLYYVYKKNAKGKFKKVKETQKLTYNDSLVEKDKTYTYKVIAVRENNGEIIKGNASALCKVLAASIDPNKKMVALTYDDGPSTYTEDILDCLKANQAKATFYVIGCNIDGHKSAVEKAHNMGCEIGNHTYNHPMLYKLSVDEIKKEIGDTDRKIKKITGSNAVTMRPPGGGLDEEVKETVGKPIILWSIDTRDWEHRNSSRTVNAVMKYVQDGDIILMHDIYAATRDASLTLIPQLRREGYQLVTVSELAQYRGYTMKKGTVYKNLRKKK